LVPKKHKEVLRKTVEKNGFDVGFADDAVSFFWSEIRKNLSDLSDISIVIKRLGTFNIKKWKVDQFITDYSKHLENIDAMTFKEAGYRRAMEKQYLDFVRIKVEIEKEEKKKLEKKEIRSQYESAKTMGEQVQDNGGTPEQRNQEG